MIMYIQGFIPFGNDKSLASMDAHIQYIDLYAYLKDVILGKNNFSYTFPMCWVEAALPFLAISSLLPLIY